MDPNLIIDIGMNNGDDTAYYLHLGYRVIGVEANPLLADKCRERFVGQPVTVVNAGILGQPGTFLFYRNLTEHGWSTFDLGHKNNHGGEWEELPIPCLTTAQLIAQHGIPFFMKVDIEGADFQAIKTLTAETSPHYVSLEFNYEDPFLDTLTSLGYTAFKFVNGETFRANPDILDHQLGWRALRRVGRKIPFVRNVISRLPQSLRAKSEYDPPGKYSPSGYRFGGYCSGPFGEEAAGDWMTAAKARRWLSRTMADYKRAGRSVFWWDVHARHESALTAFGVSES